MGARGSVPYVDAGTRSCVVSSTGRSLPARGMRLRSAVTGDAAPPTRDALQQRQPCVRAWHGSGIPCEPSLRGKVKVDIQWKLFGIVHNLKKLSRYGPSFAAA